MTSDVHIEAGEREVAKLAIVIEEDAGEREMKMEWWRVEVGWIGPGGKTSCTRDENAEEDVEEKIANRGNKKWEGGD